MKKLTVLLLAIAAFMYSQAQSPLPKGRSQFNAGIGLSEWGVPFYLGLDLGVHSDITIGGEVSFRSYNENWKGSSYRHNIVGIAGNGNYHFNTLFNIPQQFDFYAGLNLGFYIWSSPSGYDGDHNSGLGLGAQIGGRYYFSKNAGINLEFGGGNAFTGGKFGLSFKL